LVLGRYLNQHCGNLAQQLREGKDQRVSESRLIIQSAV
jgi:hypothetical protein